MRRRLRLICCLRLVTYALQLNACCLFLLLFHAEQTHTRRLENVYELQFRAIVLMARKYENQQSNEGHSVKTHARIAEKARLRGAQGEKVGTAYL